MKWICAGLFTLLFVGGWAVGAADGPYLPQRALISAVMFGALAILANLAEARGWLDDDPEKGGDTMRYGKKIAARKAQSREYSPDRVLTGMRVLDLRCLPGGKLEVIAAETGKPVVIRQDQVKAQNGPILFIQRWLDRRIFGQHRQRAKA